MIAGGGAVAYGVTADGRAWTTSGWGYVIGDEGSGYNVGRAAINSVFRAFDKRDPPTRLTQHILNRLRVSSPVELKYAIFEGRISFQDIADLTSLVASTALEGDSASRCILEGAGRDLAEAVIAVAQALDIITDHVDIYPTGGLFQEGQYVMPAFNGAILAALPQARIRQPAFEPIVGTLFFALRELGREIDGALLKRLTESWDKVRREKELFGGRE
jgi:N-acetylglucosamine kinase-like BadF-type ATPase